MTPSTQDSAQRHNPKAGPKASQKSDSPDLARQCALNALSDIEQGQFADAALHRVLGARGLDAVSRSFVTELVYGITRQRRTLDALIGQMTTRDRQRHPLKVHLILRLGLYQLRYLNQVPPSAAVNTSVELTKQNGFRGLAGFVNGVLRRYLRESATESSTTQAQKNDVESDSASSAESLESTDPLILPDDPVARLGILYSLPDWIVQVWVDQLGISEAEQLCRWLNQSPALDLRVNRTRADLETVRQAFAEVGIVCAPLPGVPDALRLGASVGAITELPGYAEGWWSIQDASAQLVSRLLDPQPDEIVIDACAAPGGKTTHIAELMGDRGQVWACDRNAKRLQKVDENRQRLQLHSIHIQPGDMRSPDLDLPLADRVLVDAPCSGLGTLHRHADARWRQSPEQVVQLVELQGELLNQASQRVKAGGTLVYATCTLHPAENEQVVQQFLARHPDWRIDPPAPEAGWAAFQEAEGWLKIWPHRHQMDGFFVARLKHQTSP